MQKEVSLKMKAMKNIAIIPARGGSKRLPRKNVLPLGGVPLIVHSIEYALLNKEIIDEVVLSTDDTEIKQIAVDHGVKVIDRPQEISGDHEPTITALQHVLSITNEEYDNVILLQATNPLRPERMLNEAYVTFIEGGYDSLMTVTRDHHKLGKIVDGKFKPFNYTMGQRSQDLEPLYYENGLLYITKAPVIREGAILGAKNCPYILDHPFAKIDIDNEQDLIFAELTINALNHER